MEGLGTSTPSNDYAYNGKELNEDFGLNLSDYGARWYDAALGRWGAVDPLAEKYTSWSGYNYVMGNPIKMVDPDGMAVSDIVHFDVTGKEIKREKSDHIFKTFIDITVAGTTNSIEAPMPGVVEGYEEAKYQKYDYEIAANVFLLNYNIANDKNMLPTPSENHKLGEKMPAPLDVNLVKAMIIEETEAGAGAGPSGTGETDILQVNNIGDWNDTKERVGLVKGENMTPSKSVNSGIQWLFLKGMASDANGTMNWRNGNGGNWWNAVERYNGGGNPNYKKEVEAYYNSIMPANPNNYQSK